ncbi:MAG: hypothetical protein ACO3KD_04685 [Gaiellales bacterium]
MDRVKISSKHQITIGKHAFDAAGFRAGDVVGVRALGPGRVEVVSVGAFLDEYEGCLDTGGALRRAVEGMRAEWD